MLAFLISIPRMHSIGTSMVNCNLHLLEGHTRDRVVDIVVIWLELECSLDAGLEMVVEGSDCFFPLFEECIWIERG